MKNNSGNQTLRWPMPVLPTKYQLRALMPSQLTRGDLPEQEYETSDGYKVRLEYRATCDNSHGECAGRLEKDCQELYGMSMAAIEAVWKRRVGRLDGWWQIVHMIKLND